MSDKPLVWLTGRVQSPPLSPTARRRVGYLLRALQHGIKLSLPESRPMPVVGSHCHELRVRDTELQKTWRVIYRADTDAVVTVAVFEKKTRATPKRFIELSKERLADYDK